MKVALIFMRQVLNHQFLHSHGHRLCLWAVTVKKDLLSAELAYLEAGLPEQMTVSSPDHKFSCRVIIPLQGRNMSTPAKTCNISLEILENAL